MTPLFIKRHIGPSKKEMRDILKSLKVSSMEELMAEVLPSEIHPLEKISLPPPLTESELLKTAQAQAGKNKIFKSYIGESYKASFLPAVIQRNIFENPAWYSPYTPYQAELAQGRLEALLNFQTMTADLTGMEIANGSLLDEGSALVEALAMAKNISEKNTKKFFVSANIFPHNQEVLKTYSSAVGWDMILGEWETFKKWDECFALILQYPSADGSVLNIEPLLKNTAKKHCLSIVSTDLLSLTLLKPPGEMGADIVVGSSQNFGIAHFFGGPHAAFFATRKKWIRQIPGRLVGVSKDRHEKPALRLTLQTREQHIRRERATSNICTSQTLLAVMASFYAIYHGPKALREIALKINNLTKKLYKFFQGFEGVKILNKSFYDSLSLQLSSQELTVKIYKAFQKRGINLGCPREACLSLTLDETTEEKDLLEIQSLFKQFCPLSSNSKAKNQRAFDSFPKNCLRQSLFLKHPVFNSYHSETELLRYIQRLEDKELSLNRSMIPLGSCTMKLNSSAELGPVSFPAFSHIHPFAPSNQTQGWLELLKELEDQLCELTGFKAFSFQPKAGSQGEYAGLLAIKKYHESQAEGHRNICLIPSSAHGTNPASALMAGLKVVPIACSKDGLMDREDLEQKLKKHASHLSALMITYPSTYGFFEEAIGEVCDKVHKSGGLVYWDGANMNALLGLSKPANLGFDIGHLNLHKSFCIPHGGGGPGAGPIGASEKLTNFLPGHIQLKKKSGAISTSPYGNAGILIISWAYIKLMGLEGLKQSAMTAIANANYMAEQLKKGYSILFKGKNNRVAHECIIDLRKFKFSANITVDDVAKRLMDYSFHAPTVSWPTAGTLMIEPTESESKKEMDRFCSALLSIRKEIEDIEKGGSPTLLKSAPHNIEDAMSDWPFPYSKQKAFYPLPWLKGRKFWPPVSRIENAFGDIQPFCSCPPLLDES